MMKWSGIVVGSVLALGLAVGLPIALGSLPAPVDLTAYLSTPRPYMLLEGPRASIPEVSVGPSSVARRVDVREWPAGLGPGLHLRTWHIDYGHRWEREVTLPLLVGPFDREGTDVCGLAVRLGAGLFDTSKAGAGIKAIVHREIARNFPFQFSDEETGIELRFPEVQETDFRIFLRQGGVDVLIGISLEDGTVFGATVPLRLVARDGSPVLERMGTVQTRWTGATRDELLKQAAEKGADAGGGLGALGGLVLLGPAGLLVGAGIGSGIGAEEGREKANRVANKRVEEEITRRLDKALDRLALGMEHFREPWSPLSRRPHDQVRLRLARDPIVSPDSIILPLCTSITVAPPKVDAAVPGSARVASPATVDVEALGGEGATIQLMADANAINQILYLLWQSGTLRELGQSSAVLDALPEQLRTLAFDVTGFDPGLPPTAMLVSRGMPERDGLSVLLGDVALGTWGDRRVVGHASTVVRIREIDHTLELSALLHDVTVNCVAPGGNAGTSLTPCLSDLLPIVREMVSEKPLVRRLSGSDLLGRLPELTFQGIKLEVSKLSASVTSGPPRVNVQVDARILAQP